VKVNSDVVMCAAPSPVDQAWLPVTSSLHSGDILNAIPSASLGTQLDIMSLQNTLSLRLGATWRHTCAPHISVCNEMVTRSSTYGLSYCYSSRRHLCHNADKDLIRTALVSVGVPTMLEPPSFSQNDGKYPEELTVFPLVLSCAELYFF